MNEQFLYPGIKGRHKFMLSFVKTGNGLGAKVPKLGSVLIISSFICGDHGDISRNHHGLLGKIIHLTFDSVGLMARRLSSPICDGVLLLLFCCRCFCFFECTFYIRLSNPICDGIHLLLFLLPLFMLL